MFKFFHGIMLNPEGCCALSSSRLSPCVSPAQKRRMYMLTLVLVLSKLRPPCPWNCCNQRDFYSQLGMFCFIFLFLPLILFASCLDLTLDLLVLLSPVFLFFFFGTHSLNLRTGRLHRWFWPFIFFLPPCSLPSSGIWGPDTLLATLLLLLEACFSSLQS